MSELNRRLKIGEDIIYPITKAENIIHLQKTVLPKLSDEEPEIKVKGKVWLVPTEDIDSENNSENTSEMLTFGAPSNAPLTFTFNGNNTNGLTFATSDSNEDLVFGTPSDEELTFDTTEELTFDDTTEELTFGAPSNEPLTFGN